MITRIKVIRETLKLSQREFGEKLGVSRDVISNIEYGRVQPKELFLRHLCQQYQINEHWLKTGEGKMFNENPEETSKFDEAINIFKTLRPEFQDYALDQIKKLAELQGKNKETEKLDPQMTVEEAEAEYIKSRSKFVQNVEPTVSNTIEGTGNKRAG